MSSILVIEDDASIRTALTRGLTERGHAVATVPNGVAGVEHVLREHPDVVLLDLGLPDVDGLTLLSMIRAASEVPVIIITGFSTESSAIEAVNLGVAGYLTKPFRVPQVLAAAAKALGE